MEQDIVRLIKNHFVLCLLKKSEKRSKITSLDAYFYIGNRTIEQDKHHEIILN